MDIEQWEGCFRLGAKMGSDLASVRLQEEMFEICRKSEKSRLLKISRVNESSPILILIFRNRRRITEKRKCEI